MPRYIRLNANNMIVSVRTGEEIVAGEIESELGESGQIKQTDGSFITPDPINIPDPLEARVSNLETLALQLGGVI